MIEKSCVWLKKICACNILLIKEYKEKCYFFGVETCNINLYNPTNVYCNIFFLLLLEVNHAFMLSESCFTNLKLFSVLLFSMFIIHFSLCFYILTQF